jgi:hypothetical protein
MEQSIARKRGNVICISTRTKEHEKGCCCINPMEELKWRCAE